MGDSQETILSEDPSVNEDEEREISEQIAEIVENNRIPITEDLFDFKPKKRGVLFPVMINVLAVAVVVGVFFFADWYTEQKKETLSVEAQSYMSAEGRLIAAIRRESEARLEEKDQEIAGIREQLQSLDEQRNQIQNQMEQEIAEREAELRQSLQQQLSLERSRLEALGRSEAEIERELEELEAEVRLEQEGRIAAYREQMQEEIAEKERELEETKAMTEQLLEQARSERENLAERAALREEELKARYEEEQRRLEARTSEAEDEIEELTTARRQEMLISDNIIGTYDVVERQLASDEFEAAEEALANLRQILLDPTVDQLPVVSRRREADLFVIDALERLVEMQAAADQEKTRESIIQTANLLTAARGLVTRGDELTSIGEMSKALSEYRDAIDMVPSMKHARSEIERIELELLQERTADALEEAAGYLEEDPSRAIEAYRQAALGGAATNMEKQAINSLFDTMQRIHSREVSALESTVAEREDEIDRLQSRLSASQRDVRNANSRIRTLESELARANRSIAEMEKSAIKSDARIETLSAMVDERDQQIDSLDDQLESKISEATALMRQVQSMQDALQNQRERADALQERLEEKDDALASARLETRNANEQIGALEASVEDRRSEAVALMRQVQNLQGVLREERAEVSSLESQIDDLESQRDEAKKTATEQTAQVITLRRELQAEKRRVETAETRASEAENRLESVHTELSHAKKRAEDAVARAETAEKRAEAAERKAEEAENRAETERQAAVAAQEQVKVWRNRAEELQTSQAQLQTAYSELQSKLEKSEEEVAQLRDSSGSSNDALSEELEAIREELVEKSDTIQTLSGELEVLEDRLAETESELAEARSAAEAARSRAEAAEQEQAEAEKETANARAEAEEAMQTVETLKAEAADAKETLVGFETRYKEYKRRIEEELAEDGSRIREASSRFDSFLRNVAEDIFPNVATLRSAIVQSLVDTEAAVAAESGRKTALNEILRYADLLKAGDTASFVARAAFDALASKDLLYKRVFDRIDELAADDSTGAGSGTLQRLVEIGTVGNFEAGKITIAVGTGADVSPEQGDTVLVKRLTGEGVEKSIAQGLVIAGGTGEVQADIRLYLDETPPSPGDTVYLETYISVSEDQG